MSQVREKKKNKGPKLKLFLLFDKKELCKFDREKISKVLNLKEIHHIDIYLKRNSQKMFD